MSTRLTGTTLALIASCATPRAEPQSTPNLAPAPKFNSADDRLHGTMKEMAVSVLQLNDILRVGDPSSEAQHEHILASLARLEHAMGSLEDPAHFENHPLLQANLDAFRSDVRRARMAAESDPPNYYLAGSVAGSCLYCHGIQP